MAFRTSLMTKLGTALGKGASPSKSHEQLGWGKRRGVKSSPTRRSDK